MPKQSVAYRMQTSAQPKQYSPAARSTLSALLPQVRGLRLFRGANREPTAPHLPVAQKNTSQSGRTSISTRPVRGAARAQTWTEPDFEENGDLFQRERACSFYGAAAALEDDAESDDSDDDNGVPNLVSGVYVSPLISQERLRRDLDDDFEYFAHRSPANTSAAHRVRSRSDVTNVFSDRLSGSSPELKLGSSRTSHVYERPTRHLSHMQASSRERRYRAGVERGRKTTARPNVLQSPSREHRFRSSIEKLGLPTFRADAKASRHVPLFVEEAGRKPRTAFLDGHLHRVSLCRSSVDAGGIPPTWQGGCIRFFTRRLQEWEAGLGIGRMRKRRRTHVRTERGAETSARESIRRERRLFRTGWGS